MILTAHQPVYLPWLGLFHKIALADRFILFDQAQYLPKDWNNRNRIKTPQGPQWLSVPVLKKGHREKPISAIEINNTIPWGRKHWRSLNTHYSKAPYFSKYKNFFEDAYHRKWDLLSDLNLYMLQWFMDTLGIKVPVNRAGEYHFQGKKSGLVLDMCRQVGTDTYISGTLGRNYMDVDAFKAQGVRVVFQDYHHPKYPQLYGEFFSHLSIVDLLFNCGDESLGILMSGNIASVEEANGGDLYTWARPLRWKTKRSGEAIPAS